MLLDQILAKTKERLQMRMSLTPRSEMEKRARSASPVRDFLPAIRREPGAAPRFIAEFRRVNPIRGMLRPDLHPARFAAAVAQGGASALSLCTEEENFRGSLQDIAAARGVVSMPVLRRDYLLDRYQVFESRALGADAVTLHASVLDRNRLRDLLTCLKDLGMTGVVEIGEDKDLGTALAAGAQCILLDQRDARTLRPVPGKAEKLQILVPSDLALIVEIEQGTRAEIQSWKERSASALLLAEPLLLAADPAAKLRELLA